MKRWWLPLALNGLAAIVYVTVGVASGLLTHVRTDGSGFFSLFSSNDSLQYREVADWIAGGQSRPEAAAARPFLYPLMLALAQRGGLTGIWLLNVALWFVTLNMSRLATRRFVKSDWAAAVVFIALAINASLIVLTFKALTEIPTVALLAVWMYGVTNFSVRPTPGAVAWTVLPVAMLVVLRPQFEFLFVVVVVICAVGALRGPSRASGLVVLGLCAVPVAVQVGLMEHFFGYLGVSSVGDSTIRGYYLARLEVAIGQSTDIAAARARTAGMSGADMVQLVLSHAGEAVKVFGASIVENLLATSGFVRGHQRLSQVMEATAVVYFVMLIATIPLALLALWRRRDVRLALLSTAILNVLLTAGLTFSQGDRITVISVPVLLVAFALAVYELRPASSTASSTDKAGARSAART